MANNELKIKISTTADISAIQDTIKGLEGVEKVSIPASAGIKKFSDEVNSSEKLSNIFSSSVNNLSSSIKGLIASYVGYSAISSVIKSGVELTSQFEQMRIGIASLIAVNSQNITSMGNHINTSQKFALAQKASAEAIQLLRKANLETPATLAELTRGFQSALGPAMALGFSINQTVKYSTLMTQAAAAMGVPMDQLSQEMASILNGNIDMNSVVAKNIGLTNEQVKAHIKQGDVYNFLIGKLSDFGSAGKEMSKSWSGVTSNLEDSWGQFKMTIVNDSGIFNVAKSGVIELTKAMQNQNGEIDTMTRYMKDATFAGSMLYGTVLAVDTIKAIRLAMGELTLAQYAFNVAARANPYIIAGTVVAGGLTYLYDQIQKGHNEVSLAGAKDGKGYADAFVVSLKDSNPAQLSHDIIKQSQELRAEEQSIIAKLKESKGFMKESSSNDQLILTLEKRRAAIKVEQSQLIEYNNALKITLGQNTLIAKPHEKTDAEKKAEEAAKAKAEKAAEKATREAESLKQAYLSINKDIAGFTGTEHEQAIANIEDKAEKYRKEKVDEVKISELTSAAMTALYLKEDDEKRKILESYYTTIGDDSSSFYMQESDKIQKLAKDNILSNEQIIAINEADTQKFLDGKAKAIFDADEQSKEAVKTYNAGLLTAQIETYTAMGDTTSAYNLQEEDKMKKLAETGWYTNEQMLAIKTADNKKFQDEQWKKDNQFLSGLFDNVNKAMDDQFFNAMTGKFTSFGNWLKDMWSSITQSMARGLSKSLADSILGTGTNGGGIQNIFTSYGGLSGVIGSLFGSSILSPSTMQSLGASTDNAGFTTTSGNTVFDAGGQVTKQGTDYTAVLNALSTAKTAYGMAGSAYSSVTGMFTGTTASTGSLIGEGWGGLNGAGASASSSAAGMSGGTIAGGASLFFHYLSSYLWGSGGPLDQGYASQYHDNLKYGAGSLNWSQLGTAQGSNSGYGWMSDTSAWANNLKFMSDPRNQFNNGIGGFMGYQLSMLNPIGGISGHVDPITAGLLGGLFGKSSYAGSGINIADGATSKSLNGSNYDIIHHSGGWFSGSSDDYNYRPFTEDQKASIQGTIKSYEYLLGQIGVAKGIVASGGNFSTFQDFIDTSLTKGFISAINSANTNDIYTAWVDYAKTINGSITQAIMTSINDYVGSTRSFTEWKLGSGTADQLKFTADYLTKDLAALESQMGVSGVTADNYLSKYDEAIKNSFTPETINVWKSLGDALMSATDANTKYSDSLKALTPIVVKPQDMMQSRTGDATAITGQSDGTVIKAMLDTFNKLVRAIESQNTIAQLAAGRI